MFMRACAGVCACVCVRVRACVFMRACARVRVRARALASVSIAGERLRQRWKHQHKCVSDKCQIHVDALHGVAADDNRLVDGRPEADTSDQ